MYEETDDRHNEPPPRFRECEIAHEFCRDRASWIVHTHTGSEYAICHELWMAMHKTLGDPYLTVTYERLSERRTWEYREYEPDPDEDPRSEFYGYPHWNAEPPSDYQEEDTTIVEEPQLPLTTKEHEHGTA